MTLPRPSAHDNKRSKGTLRVPFCFPWGALQVVGPGAGPQPVPSAGPSAGPKVNRRPSRRIDRNRGPLRGVFRRVRPDQSDRRPPHLRGVSCTLIHGSNLSSIGASGNPGAIHPPRASSSRPCELDLATNGVVAENPQELVKGLRNRIQVGGPVCTPRLRLTVTIRIPVEDST